MGSPTDETSPGRELDPGRALGPYRLLERVGAGGMAEVWRAYRPDLDRFVAVKVLPRWYAEQPGYLERFRREARAISRLDHRNILPVYDFGEQDGFTYMVTPFFGGGTLADRLGRPWMVAEAVPVLAQLAAALDYAHGRGIVHRDVKPSNVLVADDGRPVLADFGLAELLEGAGALTEAGVLLGTPAYMSPEQAAGETVGPASDRYSLAVVAYEMLTGRRPFRGDTPLAVALAHLHEPLPPPRALNPALPATVDAVLRRGLAKASAERYESASALVGAFAAAGMAAPGAAAATGAGPRRPYKALLVGGCAAALLGLLGVLTLRPAPPAAGPTVLPARGSPVPSGPNLLPNGSFEAGTRTPTGWERGVPGGGDPRADLDWTSGTGRDGSRAISVGLPRTAAVWEFNRPGASGQDRAVAVPAAATSAIATVWCRADKPTGPGGDQSTQSDAGPFLWLIAVPPDGTRWEWDRFELDCRSEWTANGFLAPIPNDVTHATIWLGFEGPSPATVWFDDVSLSFR